jgi:hypothetical protein
MRQAREQEKSELDATLDAIKRHAETATTSARDAATAMQGVNDEQNGRLANLEAGQRTANDRIGKLETGQEKTVQKLDAICVELGVGHPAGPKSSPNPATPLKQTAAAAIGTQRVTKGVLALAAIELAIRVLDWLTNLQHPHP